MASKRQERLEQLLSEGVELPEEARVPGGDLQPEQEVDFPFELIELPAEDKSDDVPPPKKSRPERPARARSTASERQLAEVGEQLEEKITIIFGLASGIAPVTSVYATENSDKAIRALLAIAKRRPKVLAALTKIADGADALEISKFVIGLVIAIQVDTNRLKGDELPARLFGVTEIIEQHFIDADVAEHQNANVVPVVNSAYTPV